jgi:hypothetical protein
LGESTYTFEKSAYVVGIVDPEHPTYIQCRCCGAELSGGMLSEMDEQG